METITALKIFWVDDDPYGLALYQQYFQHFGYPDLHSFDNTGDCLNGLTLKPDVIFLDYHMDKLTGIDVLKKIRRFDPKSWSFSFPARRRSMLP